VAICNLILIFYTEKYEVHPASTRRMDERTSKTHSSFIFQKWANFVKKRSNMRSLNSTTNFGQIWAKVGWNVSKPVKFCPNWRRKNQPWSKYRPNWTKFDQNRWWKFKCVYLYLTIFKRISSTLAENEIMIIIILDDKITKQKNHQIYSTMKFFEQNCKKLRFSYCKTKIEVQSFVQKIST
jgi:hypothetical protein